MTKYFLTLVSAFCISQIASAESTSCYEFKIQDSVEKVSQPKIINQIWCYRELTSPMGATLIFDQENVRLELSALVEADGTVTHGSMIKGKVTTHKVKMSDLNPLPVPLQKPSHREVQNVGELDEGKLSQLQNLLLASRDEAREMRIDEGVFRASVAAGDLPWRGYWWPFRNNRLWEGDRSPLAKYDRYVQARSGVNPRTQDWEANHHQYTGASWGGHCNGWAASAILRAEPKRASVHQQSGVVFSVGDQKGILAEEDFCARVAFYGRRNYGNSSNDPKDIYPAEFHKVITYYVGQLRKVVAVDYLSSLVVDTHLISGYTLNIKKQSASTYLVSASLVVHKYDRSPSLPPGTAPTYIRNYKYTLTVNSAGQPIGGTWLSANPDFLWVPLSPVDCLSNNPRMRAQFVNEILRLPSLSREP